MKREAQWRRILRDIQAGESVTQLESYHKYGCTRLSERIREIEDYLGRKLRHEMVRVASGARVCRYSMEVKP